MLYWCLLKDLCLQVCKLFIGPGTVATWCKPSIGAGVVWANGAWVVGLGQARSLEKGLPLRGVPMHTLHHSATTPGICRKNNARRVACGAQGRGFDSLRGLRLFRLQSCYNVTPILGLLCNNLCKSGSFNWLVIVLVFSLQKYRPRAKYKKTLHWIGSWFGIYYKNSDSSNFLQTFKKPHWTRFFIPTSLIGFWLGIKN